jgi:transposase
MSEKTVPEKGRLRILENMKTTGTKRDFRALERRRFRAIRLLRKGLSRSKVAASIGVARQTVLHWDHIVEEKGESALKWNRRAGRKSAMTPEQQEKLSEMIIEGPEANGLATQIWTTRLIAFLIKREFNITYNHDHVSRILHRLGFSFQKPIRRAKERDEKAIKNWQKNVWPEIKKKPKKRGF